MFDRVKSLFSRSWSWMCMAALAAFAIVVALATRKPGSQRDPRSKRLADAAARRQLSDAYLQILTAHADKARDEAIQAGKDRLEVEQQHADRVAALAAMGADERAKEAADAARRSRERRARHFKPTGLLVVALALTSTARAEPVCIDSLDLSQLVADSNELERVEPLYRSQMGHLTVESAELRKALQTSTLATQMAVRRAMDAEAEASADRMTAEKARRRAKWWGGGGVVVGAVFTLLLAWGVK